MFTSSVKLRIRYAETDKMGFCYYGNYAQFFEVARVEMLRELGVSYKEMEDDGILLPVIHFSVNYHKPAFYDEEITVTCKVNKMPGVRITFHYETYNASNECLNDAQTDLIFLDQKLNKPVRPPQYIIDSFKPHFS